MSLEALQNINRQPLDTTAVEVTHTVHVITSRDYQKTAMRLLEEALETAQYPTQDLEVRAFGEQDVEIEAALVSTSVDGDVLDRIVARLGGTNVVSQAFWSASTTE